MLEWIKHHPFAVDAYFERVVAVSFAFPAPVLAGILPDGLELDEFQGLGFVTVALVWTKRMRPAGLPECLGNDFFLAGYRIFARLRDETGRRLRGLHILKSETDSRRMTFLGNLMTGYQYRTVRAVLEEADDTISVQTNGSGGERLLEFEIARRPVPETPPESSPFADWKSARLFAGPMPFTFSPQGGRRFVVVEGARENWTPQPVSVKKWRVQMFDEPPFRGTTPVLANAFAVSDIPYRWKRGRLVKAGGAV